MAPAIACQLVVSIRSTNQGTTIVVSAPMRPSLLLRSQVWRARFLSFEAQLRRCRHPTSLTSGDRYAERIAMRPNVRLPRLGLLPARQHGGGGQAAGARRRAQARGPDHQRSPRGCLGGLDAYWRHASSGRTRATSSPSPRISSRSKPS